MARPLARITEIGREADKRLLLEPTAAYRAHPHITGLSGSSNILVNLPRCLPKQLMRFDDRMESERLGQGAARVCCNTRKAAAQASSMDHLNQNGRLWR